MKTESGFRLRKLLGEYVLLAEDIAHVNFNRMITLNESAASLWTAFEGKEFTVQDMADELVRIYGDSVTPEQALEDSGKLARKWIEIGVVSE
jgi:hypothetical protein